METEKCPVAEMEPTECPETKYTIAPDGTVVEAQAVQENPEAFQENIQ